MLSLISFIDLNKIDMKMARIRITDIYIQQLSCLLGRSHQEFFDSELSGFYVDVQASGKKSYRLRYRLNKKLHVITLGDAAVLSADEARNLATELIRTVKHGISPKNYSRSSQGPTIADFFLEKYLPYVKSYKRSWDTDESMLRNHLVPKLGSKHMGNLSPPDVAIFLETMRAQGYALGTCNRALVLLRYGYELAIRWKVMDVVSNPVKEIKNLRDDNKIERFLSDEQARKLLIAVRQSESPMLEYIVLFLIYTGARKQEVLDAKWQDIDWDKKSWRLPKTKSGKVRHIPLSTNAYEVLVKLRNMLLEGCWGLQLKPIGLEPEPNQHIFMNVRTGKPYVSFFYSWNAARVRAGLSDFRVHDLRHSFASFLVNAGRSLYEVQELLGHADIRTTSRYAHLNRERLISAVEVVPSLGIN